MTVAQNYLSSTIKLFYYYKSLGEKAINQLEEEQLFYRPSENDNSIAIIGGHLHGNMKSRWTDFLTTDGEKEWRKREEEFEPIIKSKKELMLKWEEGWGILFLALNNLKESDLDKTIFIRNMGQTALEAVHRQLAHYAFHVGQIVFYAKMLKGKGWQSLSIPKGKSDSYNAKKFSQQKKIQHFTTEFLK